MDLDTSSIPFLISIFMFVFMFVFAFVFVFVPVLFRTGKPSTDLPPGPRKLPFIGNLHLLAGSALPHHTLANLANKYGPLMHLKLGQIDAVVVSSPETAEEILKRNDVVFASRPSLLATEINCYGNTDIAFSPYGDYWRQLRKICTLQLLTARRVQSFRPIREGEVSELCNWIALQEGSTINLTEKLITTNLNIMIMAAFGKKSGEVGKLKDIIMEAHELVTVFNIVDVYPSLKFLRLFSGMRKKIEEHHRHLNRITESVIEERRRQGDAAEGGGGGEDEGDFLGVMLKLQGDGSLEIPLTTDNIKAVLLDGAGVESSTTTVDWAMAEMLKNPTILQKAQDEVRGVFDGKNYVDESCFHELNYLKLVIKETLRLHPPGPLLLPRQSREPCAINGYQIPSKTWVLVNAWAIGRDPKHWKDAECFKPERFLEKIVDFKANTFDYIPFGAGRRICPGIGFGIANIEIELATLLYHFDWILPHGMEPQELDMTELSGMSGRRKCSFNVIPIIRRPLL
ncbi:salviol synthase-like [Salvia miltiorrhiza]|uniref:salviol synthase-like n=1 Tax=Salvia miltiorrhiza TaxID=226208 RepID=UPI0025AD494B|nr:salviol synthase-like [Salvia miltiorrhiza]